MFGLFFFTQETWYTCTMLVPQTPLLIGNWKTYPKTYSEVITLSEALHVLRGITLCVCPPPLFLREARTLLDKKILLGAQNYSSLETSPLTSGVALDQLLDVPVTMCIVGHSSSREQGESDEVVNKKVHECLAKDIVPIVCIGESTRDTEGRFFLQLQNQIEQTCKGLSKQDFEHIVIAYEPLWAIGSSAQGQATKEQFEEIVVFIKKVIADMTGHIGIGKISIVYGGSVSTPQDVVEYMQAGAQGILVGRASLDGKLFMSLGEALQDYA